MKSTALNSLETKAKSLRIPAWVVDSGSGRIIYTNPPSLKWFGNIDSDATLQSLSPGSEIFLQSAVEAHIHSGHVEIDVGNSRLKSEVMAYAEGNEVLLSFHKLPEKTSEPRVDIMVYSLDRDGIIRNTPQKDNLSVYRAKPFTDLFSDSDKESLFVALQNCVENDAEEFVEVQPNAEMGLGEERAIVKFSWFKDIGRIVAVVTGGSSKDIVKTAPSDTLRADLARDINEILKMEIAEHRRTLARLGRAENFSKNLLDSSLYMILSFDDELNIVEVNRTAEKAFGASREELKGSSCKRFFRDQDRFLEMLDRINEVGSFNNEMECINSEGNHFSTFASCTRIVDETGQNRGYMCSLRDLSEIKKWRKQLQLTEERYSDLFENATDMISGVGMNGEIIYANRSWHRKLGYSEEEMKGMKVFDILDPKSLESFKTYFENLKNGRRTEIRIWKLTNKSGETFIVETNDNLKFDDNKPQLIRSIMRDVTDAVKSEENMKDQAAKIKAIFESGSVMLWTVNKNTALTSFNSKYSEAIMAQYGVRPEINKNIDQPKKSFASNAYHDFWRKKYTHVFNTGESLNFQTKTRDMKGRVHHRDIHLNPIKYGKEGKVNEVAGMGIDITEKKETERELEEQSQKIRTIFNSTNQIIWSMDTDFKLTFFNESFERKLRDRFDIEVNLGDSLTDIYEHCVPGSSTEWKTHFLRVLDGQKIQLEDEIVDRFNIVHREEVSLSPIFNEQGLVTEITGLSQTVTFKKNAERKLKEQAAKIHAIFDSTAMLIWTVDSDFRIMAYNKVFGDRHLALLDKEVSIGSNFVDVLRPRLDESALRDLKIYFKKAFSGEKQQFEGRITGSDGLMRWMETYFSPIYSDHNEIKEISCISHEITDKKVIEENMRNTIREKEILLQEVHHRVKNNLQVISSILNLQSSYVKDEGSLNILRESQNRIKSMSFIHESLYQTKDFSGIDFSDYILTLTSNLIHTYSLETGKISLRTELHKTNLSLDQAIPCGLIVNEIVSNALKYAFPERGEGEIFLSVREKKKQIYIEIADNGVGMPEGLNPEESDTLGLQLIYTLIEQLEATIDLNLDKGTKYLITFEKQL